jgi:hypothetical protein
VVTHGEQVTIETIFAVDSMIGGIYLLTSVPLATRGLDNAADATADSAGKQACLRPCC